MAALPPLPLPGHPMMACCHSRRIFISLEDQGARGPHMTRPYRLISADSHVNEPPNLWLDRVATKFRDRAPRVEHLAEGDAWILEGVEDPVNFGWNACAGLEPEQMEGWVRFEDIRAGGYDPAARIVEMDRDRVD